MSTVAAARSNPAGWAGLQPAGGRLLVAAPVLTEPTFARTVVYLLEHEASGTAGVILNRPSHTPVGQVLPGWQDAVNEPGVVFGGGPVQPDGALCLGLSTVLSSGLASAVSNEDVLVASGGALRPLTGAGGVCTVDLDGDVDLLAAITTRLRVFAGHAGWTAGQLDSELGEGAWFVVECLASDVFSGEPAGLWRQVLLRQPPPLRFVSSYPRDPSLN
jgi:putative transcriptional regulator